MQRVNQTHVTEFILLGVTNLPDVKIIVFSFSLLFYTLSFLGNSITIFVVIIEPKLHNPMYYLLSNLSFLDFCFSTVSVPKMLADIIVEGNKISFGGCIAQLHFFHVLGGTECMLLAFMSYDRYVAICHPLRYITIMNNRVCILLACTSWATGFIYSLFHTILTARLPFCASNRIDHFYCALKPILKLACTDTYVNERLVTILSGSVSLSTFVLIMVSYIYIGYNLAKMKSSQGKQKAFSTCTAHLTVILIYFGTAMSTFLRPSTKDSLNMDRVTALFVTVVTPALNPIIYALRNKDVKRSVKKVLCGRILL